ncbi:hypothetical protein [Soonwooa sp.]|uniref:hypothetical protein n=1 Tax=Soonwooa sp. TaxID=1938592 RepID=UPI0026227F07|nr:hypothetical protein [Soonwooa sp.]
MKEKLKYIAKISSIGVFNFLKVNTLGAFSTIISCIIGFFMIGSSIDAGHTGHAGVVPFLVITFITRPISSVLWLVSAFVSPYLFFALANKYALMKVANRFVKDHSDEYIKQVLDKIINMVLADNSFASKGADYAMLKLKMLDQLKQEQENKWLKRIIAFGIKKINLDDIDFQDKTLTPKVVISNKILAAIENFTDASLKPTWILIGIQWLLLVFYWLVKF